MEKYLDDCNDAVSLRRNSTRVSRFSEALITTFLSYGASKSYVRYAETPFDYEALYRGLYNVSQKNDFKGLVKVHKQNGKIILLRCKQ